jgi:hypothetical protein
VIGSDFLGCHRSPLLPATSLAGAPAFMKVASWVAADCSSVPFASWSSGFHGGGGQRHPRIRQQLKVPHSPASLKSWSSGFHGDARAPTTPGLSFFRSFLVRFVLQIQKRFHGLDPHVVCCDLRWRCNFRLYDPFCSF